jgi:polysaccharide export outer membrane protein
MKTNLKVSTLAIAVLFFVTAGAAATLAQTTQKPVAAQAKPAVPTAAPQTVTGQVVPPDDYVIGTDDILIVMFRREKDMSAEVAVRPDGKITLPLLNDVQATGLTPDQLREKVTEGASRLVEEPSVTVMVKEINSRKVFITGQVAKPGAYDFGTRMTVLQLIAMAGGLGEFAKGKEILVIRETPGAAGRPGAQPVTFKFNYHEVQKGKNLASNLELKPGDTVIVP